ncbi:hypothetical protein HBH69_119900 [Parastagonospora nodorum]|nr:hypothetical protein HBH69_119900 [Parastagonospora nodorum]KAH6205910.1 hypothetical protein HBI53_132780 [Parastagonospora nodorum]
MTNLHPSISNSHLLDLENRNQPSQGTKHYYMCTTHPVLYRCRHPKTTHIHKLPGDECNDSSIPGKPWVLEKECPSRRRNTQKVNNEAEGTSITKSNGQTKAYEVHEKKCSEQGQVY